MELEATHKKNPSKLELRSLIKFYSLNGKKPNKIMKKINSVYGDGTVKLKMVYKWRSRFLKGNFSVTDKCRSGRPPIKKLDVEISKIFKIKPNLSAKSAGRYLGHHTSTITSHLKKMSKKRRNLKWVPHQLIKSEKKKRVEYAKIMLDTLKTVRYRSNVWTGDESWIYYDNPNESMWIGKEEKIPTRIRRSIGSKKIMVNVIWSESGMKSITKVPPDVSFNKVFFIETVLDDIRRNLESTRPKLMGSGLFLHLDNARPHLANFEISDLGFTRLVHPAYSPDLAPSDFFLFGNLKTKLQGTNFSNEDDLFAKVVEILHSIPHLDLTKAYDKRMIRLQKCIDIGGEYTE